VAILELERCIPDKFSELGQRHASAGMSFDFGDAFIVRGLLVGGDGDTRLVGGDGMPKFIEQFDSVGDGQSPHGFAYGGLGHDTSSENTLWFAVP
jgi:hypothetical protein